MTTNDSNLHDIREKLYHTNKVFFSNFPQLTDIQNKTIPVILKGQNAVILSPTASGKTEAVIAPICEKLLSKYERISEICKLFVIYIVPTRALVNDIYKRLENSLSRLNISSSSKTSDLNNFKIDSPQNILFTTPESFDSLLMRHPEVLENVEFVVIDELHFLDNNYRGDQLRVLLKRLKHRVKNPESLKFYAMSATINNPEELGKRYFENFELIISKGSRKIIFESINAEECFKKLNKIQDIFIKKKILRAIFFCNSRRTTIMITKKLKDIFGRDDRIFEYHSSLDKKIRKYVENEMGRTDRIMSLCVSTSSLEVGIDIGNLEAIVLIEPPLTVSSLLQRIGRGSRRTNTTVCYGVYENEEDRETFEEMIDDAKNEIIEEIQYAPELSVCVQQILSLTMEKNQEKGNLTRKQIYEFLKPLENDSTIIDLIIDKLISKEYLQEIQGNIKSDTKLLDFDDKTRGRINVNISGDSGMLNVESITGEKIGEIANPNSKLSKIQFASNKWIVIDIKKDKIIVERTKSGNTEIPRFNQNSKHGYFHSWLPNKLK